MGVGRLLNLLSCQLGDLLDFITLQNALSCWLRISSDLTNNQLVTRALKLESQIQLRDYFPSPLLVSTKHSITTTKDGRVPICSKKPLFWLKESTHSCVLSGFCAQFTGTKIFVLCLITTLHHWDQIKKAFLTRNRFRCLSLAQVSSRRFPIGSLLLLESHFEPPLCLCRLALLRLFPHVNNSTCFAVGEGRNRLLCQLFEGELEGLQGEREVFEEFEIGQCPSFGIHCLWSRFRGSFM